jgi:hypothetical protein
VNPLLFEGFLRKAAVEVFPDEVEAFEADARGLVRTVLSGRCLDTGRSGSPLESEMGVEEGTALIGLMSLALGTYDLARKIGRERHDERSTNDINALRERWQKHLEERGLQAEEARAIVQRFHEDLIALIRGMK